MGILSHVLSGMLAARMSRKQNDVEIHRLSLRTSMAAGFMESAFACIVSCSGLLTIWSLDMFSDICHFMKFPVLDRIEQRLEGTCGFIIDGLHTPPFQFGACQNQ